MRSCTLTGIKHFKMKNDKNYPDMPASEGLPCISLILPFEPNMNNEKGLFNLLTIAANKAELNLLNDYSEKQVAEVIKKLRKLILGVHCQPHEMTVCIFVSPLTGKVCYFTPTVLLKNYFPPVLKKM
jgi:hypothetical protein